jgi:hypothetical protein
VLADGRLFARFSSVAFSFHLTPPRCGTIGLDWPILWVQYRKTPLPYLSRVPCILVPVLDSFDFLTVFFFHYIWGRVRTLPMHYMMLAIVLYLLGASTVTSRKGRLLTDNPSDAAFVVPEDDDDDGIPHVAR